MDPLLAVCSWSASSMVLFHYVGYFWRKLERWREGDVTEQHTMEQLSILSKGKTPLQEVRLTTTHEG